LTAAGEIQILDHPTQVTLAKQALVDGRRLPFNQGEVGRKFPGPQIGPVKAPPPAGASIEDIQMLADRPFKIGRILQLDLASIT